MKATGIVRRIDDLGRVVIPKEIRRTMRIREGDPLEIYTSKEGEVIFKKYSLMGDIDDLAGQFCEALSKNVSGIVAVTDRDTVISIAGGGKRELLEKRISGELEKILEDRSIYRDTSGEGTVAVTDGNEKYTVYLAAPIHGCTGKNWRRNRVRAGGDGCHVFRAAYGELKRVPEGRICRSGTFCAVQCLE